MEVKISAKDVKALRDITGAGMMDCKKALVESGGDHEGAIEYLRKKGQKLANKRADREAKEGVVIAKISADKKRGVVAKVSCETDFVAMNEDFIAFADKIATICLDNFAPTLEAALALPFDDITIGEKIIEQVGVIGEKVELKDYAVLEGEMLVSYIHAGYKAGVIVALNKANADFEAAGKDVAMQVAAMKPIALDKGDVDQSVIDKEIEIAKEVIRNEGKPEAMVEKIAMGKLNRFYKDFTLVNQIFVKDNKKTVAQFLDSVEKGLAATGFKHITLG